MTPIKGDFAQIYLRENGTTEGFKIVGCTTGDTFNDTTELAEVTGLTSDFVEFKPTYKTANLTTDALLIYADGGDAQYASEVLLQWSKDKQKLDFLYIYGDGLTEKEIEGACYINSCSVNAPSNDFGSVQISLQCTGEWTLTF